MHASMAYWTHMHTFMAYWTHTHAPTTYWTPTCGPTACWPPTPAGHLRLLDTYAHPYCLRSGVRGTGTSGPCVPVAGAGGQEQEESPGGMRGTGTSWPRLPRAPLWPTGHLHTPLRPAGHLRMPLWHAGHIRTHLRLLDTFAQLYLSPRLDNADHNLGDEVNDKRHTCTPLWPAGHLQTPLRHSGHLCVHMRLLDTYAHTYAFWTPTCCAWTTICCIHAPMSTLLQPTGHLCAHVQPAGQLRTPYVCWTPTPIPLRLLDT